MIVTLTANPSLDRTVELAGPLARGEVQRAASGQQQPGGKGVNVCRALALAGCDTVAVLPGDDDDAVLTGLHAAAVPYVSLPIGAPLRSNITLTEPDGTTTKINEPGPVFSAELLEKLTALVLEACSAAIAEAAPESPETRRPAGWLVLAGSLPPGVPDGAYASIIGQTRARFGAGAPKIAVDSSGVPLRDVVAAGRDFAPDLLKPNAEELAELTGVSDAAALEADPALTARAARILTDGGVGAVLATLGSKGAVLVTAEGQWLATHPPVVARSTVGAGDCALAGFLLAHARGDDAPGCLRQAVAHGSAAASLPGTTIPTLEQTHPEAVVVVPL